MSKYLTEEELVAMLNNARKKVEVGALYKHYKGNVYQVIDLVIQTSDSTPCVIYRAQYGQKITFARSLKEWLEDVELEAKLFKRFSRID